MSPRAGGIMLKVTVNLDAIRHNYAVLKSITGSELMPVVKADAYGHGMVKVARVLLEQGARSFAVGSTDEGVALRQALPEAEIYALLGPVFEHDYEKIFSFGIRPVVHSWFQLEGLLRAVQPGQSLSLGIKFDTGMGRLGFKTQDAARLAGFFVSNDLLKPELIFSHLAYADAPEMAHQVDSQLKDFNLACSVFYEAGLRPGNSLANSAALLNCACISTDIVRPGIALYGGNPFVNTCFRDKGRNLVQAMSVKAPVIAVHELQKNQGISYGLTFTAPRDMRVAIIGCGYADNYSRSLSNKSWLYARGSRLPVLGRVCMQLSAVDVTGLPFIKPGDEVYVLGGDEQGGIDVHELAGWWKTISYEVFCLLGKNEKSYS